MNKLTLIGLLVFLSSCADNRFHSVSRSADIDTKYDLDKIVVIEPEFVLKNFKEDNSTKYFKSDLKDAEFRKILSKGAKKQKVAIEIYDKRNIGEEDVFYYNDLIPLKNEVLNNLSKLESDAKKTKSKKYVFKKELIIDAKFSKLIEEFDTKYFAVTGMISTKSKARVNWPMILIPPLMLHTFQPFKESLYFFVLINVESSEIEFQEVRYHNERMTKTNMNLYVYDSIKALKKSKPE